LRFVQALTNIEKKWSREDLDPIEDDITFRKVKPNQISITYRPDNKPTKYQNLYSCGSRNVIKKEKKQFYKWKDANGQSHFSDKFPEPNDYRDLVLQDLKSKNFFSLNLDKRNSKLPPFVSERLKRDVNKSWLQIRHQSQNSL